LCVLGPKALLLFWPPPSHVMPGNVRLREPWKSPVDWGPVLGSPQEPAVSLRIDISLLARMLARCWTEGVFENVNPRK